MLTDIFLFRALPFDTSSSPMYSRFIATFFPKKLINFYLIFRAGSPPEPRKINIKKNTLHNVYKFVFYNKKLGRDVGRAIFSFSLNIKRQFSATARALANPPTKTDIKIKYETFYCQALDLLPFVRFSRVNGENSGTSPVRTY